MTTILILTLLSFVIPLWIMRSFSFLQKSVVAVLITAHLFVVFAWHKHVVDSTGFPIIIDIHSDCQKYYHATKGFAARPPFMVTTGEVRDRLDEGSLNFGYQYVLAVLWTLTPHAILAVRLLKTMLYFVGLACLTRVWRTHCGPRFAMWGLVFLGAIFTPALYYNFRNLKDGLILDVFLLLFALLDTILRPRDDRFPRHHFVRGFFSWATIVFLILAISTMRLYAAAMIVVAITMHIITASRMTLRTRTTLVILVAITAFLGVQTGTVGEILQLGIEQVGQLSLWSGYGLLQAFLSPLPWNPALEPYLAFFYWIYWALLPYTWYAMLRHLRSNMTWHLYLYIMIAYLASGPIGDPPRKRLIVHPIMVSWVLYHLAYRRHGRAGPPHAAYQAVEQVEPARPRPGFWGREGESHARPASFSARRRTIAETPTSTPPDLPP